jgi:DNA-binding SARP family transcriptional activator
MARRSNAFASAHDAASSGRAERWVEVGSAPRYSVAAHLFGRFRVECEGRPVRGLPRGKSQELLAYLLVHRDRPHRREAVADQLWGDAAAGDPRKTMRQALWQLQSAFGGDRELVETLGGDWIGIRRAVDLWIDLDAFEAAWREIEAVPGGALSTTTSDRVRRIVDLCQGELLEGNDWEWCRFERDRLHDLLAAMVDKLMAWCEASGALATGIRLGTDLLRFDRAREQTHRSLMRLHALAGDRTGALRQYQRCTEALEEELAVAPGQATRELLAQIREDRPLTQEATARRRRDVRETEAQYNGLSANVSKRASAPGGAAP